MHARPAQRPRGEALAATQPSAAASATSGTAGRWLALDVFRALAVLWMIQGHTFTAMLDLRLYVGAWVQPYSLLHGLTAPMFLIGAGVSYGVVMFGGSADPAALGARSRRIVVRSLRLLAIGTVLQLPRTSLFEVIMRRDLWSASLQPGALQLVAAGLLGAEGLRVLSRSRAGFAAAATGVTAALAFVAPWVWNARSSQSAALGSWLDGQAGSQFPLVPWLCFFFVGAALSAAWGSRLWLQGARFARGVMPVVGIVAFVCSATCYGLFLSGVRLTTLYGEHSFWYSNPLFVVFRTGLALAWLGALSASATWISRALAALPRCTAVIRALAKYSLIAYVAHLVLLYGTPFNPGLAHGGPHYDFPATAAAFVCVLALTIASVLAWDRWQAAGGLRALFNVLRAAREPDAPRS